MEASPKDVALCCGSKRANCPANPQCEDRVRKEGSIECAGDVCNEYVECCEEATCRNAAAPECPNGAHAGPCFIPHGSTTCRADTCCNERCPASPSNGVITCPAGSSLRPAADEAYCTNGPCTHDDAKTCCVASVSVCPLDLNCLSATLTLKTGAHVCAGPECTVDECCEPATCALNAPDCGGAGSSLIKGAATRQCDRMPKELGFGACSPDECCAAGCSSMSGRCGDGTQLNEHAFCADMMCTSYDSPTCCPCLADHVRSTEDPSLCVPLQARCRTVDDCATDPYIRTSCSPTMGCVYEPFDPCAGVDCDDGNPRTTDSCNPFTGDCVHTPSRPQAG